MGQNIKTTFIAFTTKGLEKISEQELKKQFPEISILEILTKRIIFSIPNPNVKKLLKLRTIDDIHILVEEFKSISNLNEDFVLKNLPSNKIKSSLDFISQFRKIDNAFSLTLSKYQNNSLDLESLKIRISETLKKSLKMEYIEKEHSNFDIRIHVEKSNISFSCKLPRESLYKRKYRTCEQKGALKPTIASSLCFLISPEKNKKIVDNFCGVGTILCEAKLQGLEIYGGDINDECVNCAVQNTKNISPNSIRNIKILDATKTKWQNSFFDYTISNLPWGKQVDLIGIVKLYSTSILEYSRILKDDGSLVLLGMNPDLIVKHIKKNFPTHKILKFKIGFLGQNPWVVCALPEEKSKTLNYLK